MVFFLSKLLPLFIYPLGLASGLLVLALVVLGRRPAWGRALVGAALVVLLLSSNGWVAAWVVRSLEWQNLPPADLPTADAIVVLGGALKPPAPPRPWVDVADEGDRVLHGARLYLAGKAPLVILSGGRVTWRDVAPSESEDMAELAMAMGVPARAMLQDPTSLNTHENAVNVRQILEANELGRVLLVTSALHMPRSLRVFQRQGIEVIPAPTDFLIPFPQPDTATTTWQGKLLTSLPQADPLRQCTRAIKEYVGLVVYGLRGWI